MPDRYEYDEKQIELAVQEIAEEIEQSGDDESQASVKIDKYGNLLIGDWEIKNISDEARKVRVAELVSGLIETVHRVIAKANRQETGKT